VSGAGPAVYGLFQRREQAVAAARRLRLRARVWVTAPVW
jgi:4-diphosphocytidyl-2C-methyl-D-erythritol kinase